MKTACVSGSENRYLLILTENYAALGILQQELLKIKNAIIIFGSSFPKDQEYTQVDTLWSSIPLLLLLLLLIIIIIIWFTKYHVVCRGAGGIWTGLAASY